MLLNLFFIQTILDVAKGVLPENNFCTVCEVGHSTAKLSEALKEMKTVRVCVCVCGGGGGRVVHVLSTVKRFFVYTVSYKSGSALYFVCAG